MGAYFDWSSLLGAASEMSLFGDKQLIEIRIPSGKPGKEGSEVVLIVIEGGGHTWPGQEPRLKA